MLRGALALLAGVTALGGGWRSEAPLPVARSEVAAAVVRGEIVVVGGYLADGSTSAAVTAYSAGTGRWRTLPSLPLAVNHAMAAAEHGRLYVIGGYDANGLPQRTAFVLEDGRWRALPRLPAARAAGGAAIVGDRLYVVGGVEPAPDAARRLASRSEVLDLVRLHWTTIAGPAPREHLAVTATGGKVYALAGRLGGIDTNLSVFQLYTPGRGWRTLPAVPEARGGTAAAVSGGTIVSAGGERPEGTIAAVYGYDVVRSQWRRLPDLPTPRHGLGLAAVGGRIYAVAGGLVPGLSASTTVESIALG